jgi:hypothetical protein
VGNKIVAVTTAGGAMRRGLSRMSALAVARAWWPGAAGLAASGTWGNATQGPELSQTWGDAAEVPGTP